MKKCPKCELNWIQDNEDICICCEPKLSATHEKAITFYKLGLKCGEYITFTKDPQYKAKIIDEMTLLFEDKEYKITPLGQMLLKRIGNPRYEQLGSGFGVFKYDEQDRNLVYRYLRLNPKDNENSIVWPRCLPIATLSITFLTHISKQTKDHSTQSFEKLKKFSL